MMAIVSVLESAVTVSPALMPTETTVPLIGLVSVASFSDCCALVSWASAVSIAAWSLAICSGESELADPAPPVVPALPVPLPVAPAPELPVMSAVRVASVVAAESAPDWVGEVPESLPDVG